MLRAADIRIGWSKNPTGIRERREKKTSTTTSIEDQVPFIRNVNTIDHASVSVSLSGKVQKTHTFCRSVSNLGSTRVVPRSYS